MATLGLDDSAYRQGVEEAKAQTKAAVSTMSADYNRLYSEVIHLTAAYQKSRRETGETSKETKEFAQKLKEAQAQLNTTSQGLRAAEGYMSSFGDAASGSSKSLAGAIAQGTIMAGFFSKLSSAALAAAKSLIQSGIEYNAQIESYRVGLTNMLGDAQAANEAMAAIQEDAARTPFSVDSLTQANQLLISAGENAEYSRKVIMALGDAVSATGGGNTELSRMAANLQQIANVGKASAIDIKQFAYAGINVYQVLADYTGKSVQEVQNMTISYDLLSEALIAASEEGGRYYNAMDTQSQTMDGRISTLKDNVNQLAGLMTGNLTSAIGQVIEKLNDMTVAAIEAYKTDGWEGLILKLTGLEKVGKRVGATFAGIAAQVKAMASGDLSEWKAFFDPTGQSGTAYKKAYNEYLGNKNAGTKDDNYWKQYGDRMAKQYGITGTETKSSIPASLSTGTSTGKSSGKSSATAKKTAQVIDALTEKSESVADGITTAIQTVREKYDDGTEHITKTVTESGTKIVDGVAKNYKAITKYVDGVQKKVEKTVEEIDRSVSAIQSKIDKNLSTAKSEWSNGILGTFQSVLTDLKNGSWDSLAMDFVKLIWGEVSQDQRELISKWAADALSVINDAYSGGGVKAAFATIKSLFTDGIAASATEAGTAVQSFGSILSSLSASGGAGAQLANVASGVSSMATSIMGSLGRIVSLVASNPVLAAILGVAAVAGGIGLAAWLGSKNGEKESTDSKSTTLSYKDIQDAYWYGSQRSFAGYDFRTDGYAFGESPANGRLSSYQQKMQQSVDALYNVVQQYLPQTANTVIKLDDGTLVGALAPSIDAQLGHLATLAERGN